MPLGIGLRDERQFFPGTGSRKLEGKTLDAFDTGAREYGYVEADFLGQANMDPASSTGIFTLGILPDNNPVQIVRRNIGKRPFYAWKKAGRADPRV